MQEAAEENPHLPKMLKTDNGHAPKAPTNVENTGISRQELIGLAIKAAYSVSSFTTLWIANKILLPQVVVVDLIEELREEKMLEVKRQDKDGTYHYAISQRGREQAERLMHVCGYVGPAPVSLEAYGAMLESQVNRFPDVKFDDVQEALSKLKLPADVIEVAGMAVSSGKSLFLSGPPGNGKTTMARLLHTVLPGELWIPHCIAVDNNIICLFDPHCHRSVNPEADLVASPTIDKRWVRIYRPLIVTGGEMTLQSLDLAYRPGLRYYEAPLHMKANGGTFLIDDFGRQHVSPEDLLNRWIIPMEHHFDYLTLHSGQKIEVPFILMLLFATNLDPEDVTDPAFLRRIGYRLALRAPEPDFYEEIFREYAARYNIHVPDELMKALLERYINSGRELRSCEPRDLLERVRDICKYRNIDARLDQELIDTAWRGYFGEGLAQAS
ncbi:MAG: ATP-binding protein [Alphaproteobacteria bacterium]